MGRTKPTKGYTMARRIEYSEAQANEDAEQILRKVLKRQRFGYEVRDALSDALQKIVQRAASA
ncbi:hypothetical protein [Citromicrobium sp. JLT1363]|uniref:hypothetical protein n=1 Tax=Citromicrobium sp. JLT1363 TaxID=517722 RepID=UPI000225E82C|nr:hypothetical protein [Citromicrobium sp. JLT1363]